MYNMESYCLKSKKKKKKKKKKKPKLFSVSNGKAMLLSKCAICGSKKSKFIKNQKAKGLLSYLGVKTSLSKAQILGDILF